jgi:hypothetical protein
VPAKITTPDTVETRIGTLRLRRFLARLRSRQPAGMGQIAQERTFLDWSIVVGCLSSCMAARDRQKHDLNGLDNTHGRKR